jgi:hypothetical protein
MKLAFCFLIYDTINHEDLWDVFFADVDRSLYSIYVHYKTDVPLGPRFESGKLPHCIPTKWGDISLVKAQNLMLEAALRDEANTHFIFLSNSCIPLKSFAHVYSALTEKSVFNICAHAECFPRCNRALRFIERGTIQKAHQWCVLNRPHAQLLVDESAVYMDWFDVCGDEHCYISLIFHRGLQSEVTTTQNLSEGATTFTNFSPEGIPKTYAHVTHEELERLLASGSLFGRKFHPGCSSSLHSRGYLDAIGAGPDDRRA